MQDQQKIILPMNRDTENIYYNQRLIIDNNVITEPRTWEVSKVNRINSNGVVLITTAQTLFDPHRDFIEKDNDGNVIGMWASFFDSGYIPQDPPSDEEVLPTISYSGIKPELKVNGSYKKLTTSDGGGGTWSYAISGEDASSLVNVLTAAESSDVEDNQIKIKFTGSSIYIGETLVVTYTNESGATSIRLAIISL